MSVIKAKSVESKNIDVCSPRSIIDGKSYTFLVMYNNLESVTIQLPRCQLISGLYESDGKCYCEIAIPTSGIIHKLYFDIAYRIQELLQKGGKFGNVSFVGHMRRLTDTISCLRLKFPQNKAKTTTDIVSKDDQYVPFSKFVKGCTIIPIVSIEHVYIINQSLGFNFLLKKAVLVD